jgi:hypothetical protein
MSHEPARRLSGLRASQPTPSTPPRSALACARHDLRSAVHTVLGFADLLESPTFGDLSGEQSHFVRQLRAAADRLLELADACVDLADASAGRGGSEDVVPLRVAAFLRQTSLAIAYGEQHAPPVLTVDDALDRRETAVDVEILRRVFALGALLLRRDGPHALRIDGVPFEDTAIVTLSHGADADALLFATADELEPTLSSRELVRIKLMEVLLARFGGKLRASSNLRVLELCLPLVPA